MTDDLTGQSALTADGTVWKVTWLPGRELTRSQAVTAMMLGRHLATSTHDQRYQQLMNRWAQELHLTLAKARDMINAAVVP